MEPINYITQVQQPFNAGLVGFAQGAQIGQVVQEQRQRDAALQQQALLKQDLAALAANPNPTARDYSNLTLRHPQLIEHFKQAWGMVNEEQKASRINQATQVYAALESNNPEVAQRLLTEQASAFRNSGDEERAKQAEVMSELLKVNPDQGKRSIGLMLAANMGPEKFESTFSGLATTSRADEKQPADVKEANARAESAAVAAKFAESNAVKDLEKKGWDIKKVQSDIDVSKANVAIARQNAAIARETNALKRDELKLQLQKMETERDDKLREKMANVESGRASIDNLLNTADKVLNLDDGVLANVLGPIDSRLPTLRDATADAEAMIETLGSQAFLAQIPALKGLGALSNAEGEKLQAALASFNTKQSPEQFKANLREVQRLMLKARASLATRYGVPESSPDTPAATPGADEVDALLSKYGAP